MTLFEDKTHVFMVRIWLERREIEGASTEWRGVIEHVTSGERQYLKDMDDITAFIAPYLEQMGVRFRKRWRLRLWLKQVKKLPWNKQN